MSSDTRLETVVLLKPVSAAIRARERAPRAATCCSTTDRLWRRTLVWSAPEVTARRPSGRRRPPSGGIVMSVSSIRTTKPMRRGERPQVGRSRRASGMTNGTGGGPLVAGVDSSTQATKVVVVDADSGQVVAEGRGQHEVLGTGGARESDPRGWWEALRQALAATGRAGELRAIAVAGQQHGLVTLDGAGEPVRPAVLWNDTRSAPDAEALWAALGGPQAWA